MIKVSFNRLIDQAIKAASEKRQIELDRFLMAQISEHAKPPIKGEITQGKLRWRGISIIEEGKGMNTDYYIEQRGKVISDIITFSNEITVNEVDLS